MSYFIHFSLCITRSLSVLKVSRLAVKVEWNVNKTHILFDIIIHESDGKRGSSAVSLSFPSCEVYNVEIIRDLLIKVWQDTCTISVMSRLWAFAAKRQLSQPQLGVHHLTNYHDSHHHSDADIRCRADNNTSQLGMWVDRCRSTMSRFSHQIFPLYTDEQRAAAAYHHRQLPGLVESFVIELRHKSR